MNTNFIFTDDVSSHSAEAVCATLPRAISSKADLFTRLSRDLSFPNTFGENWDALFDCLCDLSWIRERRVVIYHEDIPALPSADLRTYLGVLGDAVASWRDNPGAHELIVVFPLTAATVL